MRLTRHLFAFAGGLAAVAVLALLMAPTGGYPSRPRFSAIGLNVPASVDGAIVGGVNGVRIETTATGAIDLVSTGGIALSAATVGGNVTVCKGAVACLDQDVVAATNSTSVPAATNLPVGGVIRVSKGADTSRASTIALAIDPDLQVTALPAGHYKVELSLVFTPGAGGSNFRIDSPASTFIIGVDRCAVTNAAATTSEALAIPCAGANVHRFVGSGGSVKALATGTISVFWAQDTSNAAATVLESDSWLEVTRLN